MVDSRGIHYSSFASHKKSYGPTDSGINLTLLFQRIQYNGGLLPDIIAAELGRNPASKHQIQPEYGDEQADAGRDG